MPYREQGSRLCDTCNCVLQWMEPTCSNCMHEKLHQLEQIRGDLDRRTHQVTLMMNTIMNCQARQGLSSL